MPSTFTTGRADLEKPANGDDVDSWNVPVNANFDAIDACFSGEMFVAFTNANVALTQPQMRNAFFVATGTLSGNVVLLFFPGIRGIFTIINSTSGAFTLSVGCGSTVSLGGTVVCPQNRSITVWCDGTSAGAADDGTALLIGATFVPPGAIMDFAMSSAPSGWLVCDGSAVSRATYAALFANISTTWGVGNGSTTFNLPNFLGQFRRGWDSSGAIDPARAFASAQGDALGSHGHGITEPNGGQGHRHQTGLASAASFSNVVVAPVDYPGTSQALTSFSTTGISINNTGGTETRPKNYAVLTCIKT